MALYWQKAMSSKRLETDRQTDREERGEVEDMSCEKSLGKRWSTSYERKADGKDPIAFDNLKQNMLKNWNTATKNADLAKADASQRNWSFLQPTTTGKWMISKHRHTTNFPSRICVWGVVCLFVYKNADPAFKNWNLLAHKLLEYINIHANIYFCARWMTP